LRRRTGSCGIRRPRGKRPWLAPRRVGRQDVKPSARRGCPVPRQRRPPNRSEEVAAGPAGASSRRPPSCRMRPSIGATPRSYQATPIGPRRCCGPHNGNWPHRHRAVEQTRNTEQPAINQDQPDIDVSTDLRLDRRVRSLSRLPRAGLVIPPVIPPTVTRPNRFRLAGLGT